MSIIGKHLAKLAEGKTEITTNMICEAERLEALEYKPHEHRYQEMLREYAMAQQNIAFDRNQFNSAYAQPCGINSLFGNSLNLGSLGSIFGGQNHWQSASRPVCPYCGR